jgi:hypothetical protein
LKIKKILFIVLLLSTTGCAVNHQAILDKRLTYESEKLIKGLDINSKKWSVKGADENKNLFANINNDGLLGSANYYNLDIGLTFNALLEQAGFYSGLACQNDCKIIDVQINSFNTNFYIGLQGGTSAGFLADLTVKMPRKSLSFTKTYQHTVNDNDQVPRNGKPFNMQLYSMEKVLIQVLKDIRERLSALEDVAN